jgi:hypothetical protein
MPAWAGGGHHPRGDGANLDGLADPEQALNWEPSGRKAGPALNMPATSPARWQCSRRCRAPTEGLLEVGCRRQVVGWQEPVDGEPLLPHGR